MWTGRPVHGRYRRLRLMTARGLLRVRVCPLCGALIVADAAEQHDAVHRADVRRTGSGGR
jgi:hypothetical protein